MLMSATFPDRRCLIKQAVSINLFSPERNKDLHSGDIETLSLIYLPTCMLIFAPMFLVPGSYCWDSYQWQRLDFAFKSELYILRSPDRTQGTNTHTHRQTDRVRERGEKKCSELCENILPHKRQFICIFLCQRTGRHPWHLKSELSWLLFTLTLWAEWFEFNTHTTMDKQTKKKEKRKRVNKLCGFIVYIWNYIYFLPKR